MEEKREKLPKERLKKRELEDHNEELARELN